MANNWYLTFGTGKPSDQTGLTPTLTQFSVEGVTAIPAPGITETPAGSGFYRFQYTPTNSISFEADGGAAVTNGRYIKGAIDPSMVLANQVGDVSSSFGSTSLDPTTIIGWLKRIQEFLEGNATFDKSSGVWSVSSRGSSTLLVEKTLTNTTSEATKS